MADKLITFYLAKDIKILGKDGKLHDVSKISFTSADQFFIIEEPDTYYVALKTHLLAFPILEYENQLWDILTEAGLSEEEIKNKFIVQG